MIFDGALGSLAGNIDPHHRVSVADVILVQRCVPETLERLVARARPDVMGLSVMTFQRETARRVIRFVRALKPDVRVVVGGYDASLAPEAYAAPDSGVHFIVRGEGEITFRELLRALEYIVQAMTSSIANHGETLAPVMRAAHLDAEEVEFLRWRADRWMKLRHFPFALAHDPLWVARHGLRMFAHTFRGSSLKSALGLEDARAVFRRYREIRRREREYLPADAEIRRLTTERTEDVEELTTDATEDTEGFTTEITERTESSIQPQR